MWRPGSTRSSGRPAGDSPEHSVFVETVPGKGYRFVAPVHVVPVGSDAVPAAAGPQPAVANSRSRTRGRLALGALAVVVAGSLGIWGVDRTAARLA